MCCVYNNAIPLRPNDLNSPKEQKVYGYSLGKRSNECRMEAVEEYDGQTKRDQSSQAHCGEGINRSSQDVLEAERQVVELQHCVNKLTAGSGRQV